MTVIFFYFASVTPFLVCLQSLSTPERKNRSRPPSLISGLTGESPSNSMQNVSDNKVALVPPLYNKSKSKYSPKFNSFILKIHNGLYQPLIWINPIVFLGVNVYSYLNVKLVCIHVHAFQMWI